MSAAPVEVAVGVLIRPDNSFLIAQRPPGKPMAGYWEFPGGKLEPGETVFDALKREFMEELGIAIQEASPWAQRVFVYPHATVRLHFWRVFQWIGEPQSLEGQATHWEHIDRMAMAPWLPGALPLRRWLELPATYAISNAAEMGVMSFLVQLDRRLAAGNLRMLLLREPDMGDADFAALFAQVKRRALAHSLRLLVSSRHAPYAPHADGIHLTAADLRASTERPKATWVAASCHGTEELKHAGELGIDFAVLGPVRPTLSHPGGVALGWRGFERAISATAIPVYALGGMQWSDLDEAPRHGAHGVALMRSAWLVV